MARSGKNKNDKNDKNDKNTQDDRQKRESGLPGGGQGRTDEIDPTKGVFPVSAMQGASEDATVQPMESFGQGERGAAGYQDSGRSEIYYVNPEFKQPENAGTGASQAQASSGAGSGQQTKQTTKQGAAKMQGSSGSQSNQSGGSSGSGSNAANTRQTSRSGRSSGGSAAGSGSSGNQVAEGVMQAQGREIARANWREYLDDWSTNHQGWLTSIEVDVPGETSGRRTEVSNLPMRGLSAGLKGKDDNVISVILGHIPDEPDHFTRFINAPTRLTLQEDQGQGSGTFVVESEQDGTTYIHFKPAGTPERSGGEVF